MLHLFVLLYIVFFFFFKQKTAYEMRISDWSSDVCSSDLSVMLVQRAISSRVRAHPRQRSVAGSSVQRLMQGLAIGRRGTISTKIGRASCRERVCQYV